MKNVKIILAISYLFFTETVFAQNIGLDPKPAQEGKRGIKFENISNPEQAFGNVVNNTIGLLFTIGALGFIIMFVWGAVDWILSGGDKEKVSSARKRIVTAITGLVLLALTFVVTLVIGQILNLQDLRRLKFTLPRLTQ